MALFGAKKAVFRRTKEDNTLRIRIRKNSKNSVRTTTGSRLRDCDSKKTGWWSVADDLVTRRGDLRGTPRRRMSNFASIYAIQNVKKNTTPRLSP